MSAFTKPGSEKEFENNFSPIKPLMSDTQAYYESSRCLFCYDAPCVSACPTHIDIPLFIRQINTGNATGAAKTIYEANYFGNSCGKVCPTEVLCEGACVYNLQDVKPIEIGRLQSFATTKAIKEKKKFFSKGESKGKRIAVLGAGPAGVSCACELCSMGYDVDIFEAKSKPSGLTVYGVAPYKITNEEALDEIAYLQDQFGFNVKYDSPVLSKEEFEMLEKTYDAVFIGIGLGPTSTLKLKGEELENCVGAVEFIAELRMKKYLTKVGSRVIVLGGGNTAMDAASESARMGAKKVILAYRRSREEMGAYDFEYDLALSVGVEGRFNLQPVEIIGSTKVEGVKFKCTDESNTEFIEHCDMVIKATGQIKQAPILQNISGVKFDEKGRVVADESTYQTGNPKFFVAGDAFNGGAEVVNAVAEAKVAAKGIDKFLVRS